MKRLPFVLAFAATLCASTLFACSSNGSTGPTNTLPFTQARTVNPSSASSVLYVSSAKQNVIDVYDSDPPNRFIRSIVNGLTGPNGQAVDSSGNLFVANADGANVSVYPPNTKIPSRIYTIGLTNPVTPAVGHDGTLYVSEFHSDGSGLVFVFPPHRLSPDRQILIKPFGLALDSKNNLYATIQAGVTGRILKFTPNSNTGRDLGISLTFAGRLTIDPAGNIIVCDQGAPAVYVFRPGATKPAKTITKGLDDPFAVALDRSVKHLYVADGIAKTVNVYAYPSLKLVNVIRRTTAAFGLSVSPAAPL